MSINVSIKRDMDNLFMHLCKEGELEMVKTVLPYIVVRYYCVNWGFGDACSRGRLEVAKWLYKICKNMDIPMNNLSVTFRVTCSRGHLEVAKWLYEIEPNILDYDTGFTFILVCKHYRHLELVKWLYNLRPNECECIIENEFEKVCEEDLELAKWFHQLNPSKYYIKIENNRILDYKIIKTIEYKHEICKERKEECVICYDKLEEINTDCGHSFCTDCIKKWYKNNGRINAKCPYCRKKIEYFIKVV